MIFFRQFIESRSLLTLLLIGVFAWSTYNIGWNNDIFHTGGASALFDILEALLKPELSPYFLRIALEATWTTLSYATAGTTIAVAIGFPLGILASGVVAPSGKPKHIMMIVTRLLLGVMRSIHELIWAWFFVVAIGLSPMSAIIGLAIPYGGILGRIYADILNDVKEEPSRVLLASGASRWQVLLYGRLAIALPDMLSYTFYRFECAIRAVAILGFVGIKGLGFQIQLSLDDLLFDEVWTLLFFLIALVILADLWSSLIRRKWVI